MGITPRCKEAIKAAPISAVIEATGGSLKRVGHEFVTECLWHDDANPSLTVSDQKGFCFCHVCRASGDAIDYVQKRKGLDFLEAAEFAASILGITFETDQVDPVEAARKAAQRKSTLAKLQAEQDKYASNLLNPKARRIRQILKDRGLSREVAVEFGLGFAPSGFFGGRITIPIHNHKEELVGWTGRATGDQPGKYKNSSDSDLFQKKYLVFNEPRGMEAAREAGSIIFVEGHLDVVSMWQAGIRNVVAMQGTGAPDPLILKRLSRNIKNFILCFDGDAGGRKAAEQFMSVGGPMALEGKININVVTLPEGADPDEVIRSGGDLYDMIASAPSWLDWVIEFWLAGLDKEDTAMLTAAEDKLKELINRIKSKALRTHYIDKASRALSINAKEAEKIAGEWGQARLHYVEDRQWECRDYNATRLAVEKRMLRLYVHRPEVRPVLRPLFPAVSNPPLKWLVNRLIELEQYCTVDLTPHSCMAVVAVAEPQYLNQLRTLVRPNVHVDDSQGVLDHICDIMGAVSQTPADESDSDQSP